MNWLPLAAGTAAPLTDRALAIVLACGFVGLFIALAVLVWTRWGQARPLTKCAGLSLAAHLLLMSYAYSTRILFNQPGHWLGQTVKVYVPDANDSEEAAPHPEIGLPEPWEQAGLENAPSLNAPAPARTAIAAPLPRRAELPVAQPEAKPPPPAKVPLARVAAAEPPLELPAPRPERSAAPAPATALDPADVAAASKSAPTNDVATPTQPPASVNENTAAAESSPPSQSPAEPPAAPAVSGTGQSVAATEEAVPRRLGDGQELAEALRARVVADRLKVAQQFGATPQTEAAVAAALDWLAANQSPDGRWDADAHGAGRETRTLGHDRQGAGARADTGVSGLALLAFLGNGETHLEGKHRENVQRGLEFLLASQARDGSLASDAELFASMYCHGIATLALSEAYALTGDERLLSGLQKALRYTTTSQHAGGGWRYQPGDAGDVSQFGWQLMALRSAEMAGVPIPAETRLRMSRFLRSASSGRAKGLAGYRPGDRVSRSMTAEALVCRYFLQAENGPETLDEAAAYVIEEKPGDGTTNYYYWYYGTLAMFQRQGDQWQAWNAGLQRQLLHSQHFDGEQRGSWDPDPLWGGYGGRVYSTAMAALSLEVYYRYLPIYGDKARVQAQERLTDRPEWSPYSR